MSSPSGNTTNTTQIQSQGQGSKGQGLDTAVTTNSSNTSVLPSVSGTDPAASQVMTMASTDGNNSNAPITILTPQLQNALHGQLSGSTAPILLTVNNNGQATSILVDPTTMQVLGKAYCGWMDAFSWLLFFFDFLVHLSRRLKYTIVITRCPSSVCR